nr:hypothetical protein [uncultured Methanospirillum sp.]
MILCIICIRLILWIGLQTYGQDDWQELSREYAICNLPAVIEICIQQGTEQNLTFSRQNHPAGSALPAQASDKIRP